MQAIHFLDTNIFVYAHDPTDNIKTAKARSLITEAYASSRGVISEQVICEFCNVAVTKFATQMTTDDIVATIETELKPLLLASTSDQARLYDKTLRLRDRYSLSFYDALIIESATYFKCEIVYSEDMQHGANYGGIKVVNPFLE
jgi:predicted nucleic acid-binding protein